MAELKLLAIVGTRPEALKMMPVLEELNRRTRARSFLCLTGQHRELVNGVLEFFGRKADFDLGVMQEDQELSELTARLFAAVGPVVRQTQPDWVLVQGDTTTALVGAMVAFYNRVRLAHIEAGLRTRDRFRPFPEEVNRRVIDVLADACFAPTDLARQNLLREGVHAEHIHVTGNTIVDAALAVARRDLPPRCPRLRSISAHERLILVTAHRRESFGPPLRRICAAVQELGVRFRTRAQFVIPVHPNPSVRAVVHEMLAGIPGVLLTDPLDYPDLIHVLKRSSLVLSDSGGLQEEAPSFGVPVLVMREVTERGEGVAVGLAELVGTDTDAIVLRATEILTRPHVRAPKWRNPYGDGQAAARIVDVLMAQ